MTIDHRRQTTDDGFSWSIVYRPSSKQEFTMTNTYDTIIIYAGHNELIAADSVFTAGE